MRSLCLLLTSLILFGYPIAAAKTHRELRHFRQPLAHRYVIVFEQNVDSKTKVQSMQRQYPKIQVLHVFSHGIKGASFTLPDGGELPRDILEDPLVLYVEEVSAIVKVAHKLPRIH